jgi:hypothetical protein
MQELLALSYEDRQTAMDRFRLLQPHLEQNRSLRLVAAEAGVAFRTAQRWVALYRTSGLASLARKTRLDHGARRVVSEPMKRAIEGLALESHRVPSLPCIAKSRSMQRQSVTRFQVTGPCTTSFGRCLRAYAPLLIKEPRHTARASIWSIEGKPASRTPSGRQIMLSSISSCSRRTDRQHGRSLRS